MGELLELILVLWGLFLLPALPICSAAWFFGRKRVRWNLLDFLVLVLPYAVWLALLCTDLCSKSLANLGEALYVGVAAPLAPIIRLLLPKAWSAMAPAAILLILACVVGVAIYFSIPCLPE